MNRLIVNADDFGLTPGVNRAVLELNSNGVLSSATLMATADDFEAAARSAQHQPHFGVGCHVILVDGKPLLSSNHLPHLTVGRENSFRVTLGSFVRDLLWGQIPEREIEEEASAQIRRVQAAGVVVTHVDTHKHTHMFPGVYRPLLRAAETCGVKAIRNPFEPEWGIRATLHAGSIRKLQVKALGRMREGFLQACLDAGVRTTDGAIGVLATGSLDSSTLRSLLESMPDGTFELCCHPGYQDSELQGVRTRLRESRETERQALLEVIPRAVVPLIHFGEIG